MQLGKSKSSKKQKIKLENRDTHLLKTWQILLFTALSDLYRLRSSYKSFIAVTERTNIKGTMAMYFPNALISGIKFKIMIIKK